MRNILANTSALAFSIGLASCATTGQPAPTKPQAAADVLRGEYAKVQKGLPPQSLAPGECGLFLWSKTDEPNFIFFSRAGTETAKFWNDTAENALQRTGVGGDIFGQQLTQQTFAMEDGRKVELDMEPGDLLVSGQRVPVANIRVTDGEGWVTMKPAVGVTVCQPTE